MTYETLAYEKKGRVACVTLNRPDDGNAVDAQMSVELADLCQKVNQDDDINVVIIRGAGEVFSAGGDPAQWEAAAEASAAVAGIERVVIAAVNGDAFGPGLELALACDIRVASENARFCLPHTAHGAIPSGGGTQRLPRLVGKGKAMEMLLTAEAVDAQEALRCGLVNKVVSAERLFQEADEIADRVAPQGRVALMFAKEAVTKGADLTLEQGLRLEADLYFLIHTTEDRTEGIRSFLEKRSPQFKGR